MSKSSLTGLDWQILELLQKDGRVTISELAKLLGRSRSHLTERIERLQDSGVLTGITTQVDEEKLGFGISAFVRLQASSENHRRIIKAINQIPEAAECHVLTGAEMLIIRLLATDMAHLRELVDGLTQYGSTQTDVIFSTVKKQLEINNSLKNVIK